ncbi:NAD(P)H-hydrate epimerase [Candidatus Omnitrophota bacterium]
MLFVSCSKMKQIDKLATERFSIPSLILMENAGRSVAQEAKKMLRGRSVPIVMLCGYGNNGGDGFVAARHLHNAGYKIKVFLIGPRKPMSADTKTNFKIISKLKIKINKITNERQVKSVMGGLRKRQLIIDAIFGIGIRGELNNFYSRLFKEINSLHLPVLSIDIPSGLDADKGIALPVAIQAHKTVTMGLIKKGFLSNLAKKYLGKIIIADISLPKELL